MPDHEPYACSRCGLPVSPDARCAICNVPLCPHDIRMLDGRMLCPRCYEEESYQYHSKSCDIAAPRYRGAVVKR